MRDLQKYAEKCKKYLDNIGVEYGNVLEFVVNTRARNRWGQCRPVPEGFSININVALLDERNDEDGLINTIIHELLHTCKGCLNHGENWKTLANKVYREYGINIKRTSTAADKGVLEETRPEPVKREIKHKFICQKCGAVITRTKESKFTKNYTRYTCGRCGGRFDRVF